MNIPDPKHKKLDFKRIAARFHRRRRTVRIVPDWRREELGLPKGIGIDGRDLARAEYYARLESLIATEAAKAEEKHRPLARIGFGGRPLTVEVTTHPDNLHIERNRLERPHYDPTFRETDLPVRRNTSACPLDHMFFAGRNRLEYWEWLAGKRFEYDWQMAHRGQAVVANLEAIGPRPAPIKLSRTEAKLRRLRPTTFPPKRPSRVMSKPSGNVDLIDCRIDAQGRLGRLQAEISHMGFFLLNEVCGRERWLKDVADSIEEPADYLGPRFREALGEAADHYSTLPSSRRRRR